MITRQFLLKSAFQLIGGVLATAIMPSIASAAASASLSQCGNLANGAPTNCSWQSGNLNANQAHWLEGDSVPYQLVMSGLTPNTSYTVTIGYDTTKSGKHAIDYLTSFDRTMAGGTASLTPTNGTANECSGVTGCTSPPNTFAIPQDPNVTGAGVTPVSGNFSLFNGTITAVSSYSLSGSYTSDSQTDITVTFTSGSANAGGKTNVVLAWGGHIATRADWGQNSGAVNISGSPYHTMMVSFSGGGGGAQDRALTASAIIFPATITITKVAVPTGNASFPFTISPVLPVGTSSVSSFSLVNNGSGSNSVTYTINTASAFNVAYAFTESGVAGWSLIGLTCNVDSVSGSTASTSGSVATITPHQAGVIGCTYTNTEPTVAPPSFSPGSGTYTSVQTVSIGTTTQGASIRYTTDGSLPSETAGVLYAGPVTVGTSETLKAIAYEAGMIDSSISSASYTINLPVVATPTFSPGAGTYQTSQSVTIGTATQGASIRYTTDGSTPSETAGTLYSSPVAVNTTTTLKAIAYETGMTDSAIASASYTLPISVTISPTTATLNAGQQAKFTATVSNTSNTSVTWSINPTGVGTIDTSGNYTAPATVSTQETVTVTATSQADSTKSASASVTLLPPIAVAITPTSASLSAGQQVKFSATVSNTNNTAVTWSINPTGVGTVDTSGNYTAPATIASQQTVTVTATSQADSTKSASANVTLLPPIAVTISPTSASLGAGQRVEFSATVSNTSNTAVTWSINPTGVGTIDTSGNYTAPATIASQQTVTVTATSQADTTKSASAVVTLMAGVAVGIAPGNATLSSNETLQFSATVSNAGDTTVTWSVSPAGTGTISEEGLYTAPANYTSQQTVTITATSRADSTKSASAVVTLSAAQCSSAGYRYVRAITIDHTKVPNTDQVDFPVLVSGTFPYLATIANGGGVQSQNGYDIIFTADGAGQTPLDFEIDNYNPVTGVAAFWVRIPLLSHSTDTTFFMRYGNGSISTSQENKPGVWRNGYLSVYHLGNGTNLGVTDSGSAGYTLSGTATAATGWIGGGAVFTGNTAQYLYKESVSAYPTGPSPVTLEAWVKQTSGEVFGYGSNCICEGGVRVALYQSSSTSIGLEFQNEGFSGPIPQDSNWHHVVGVYGGGALSLNSPADQQLYVDGVNVVNSAGGGTPGFNTTELRIGGIPTVTGCCALSGSVDEIRISAGVRSADWVAAEYANQSSPSSFYSISSDDVTITPSAVGLYAQQAQQFAAVNLNSCSAAFTWSMPAGALGTLTANGLYTAPSNISSPQTITITATSQADSTFVQNATVALLPAPQGATLALTAAAPTPYVVTTSQQFSAALKTADGTPLSGIVVTFAVTGANGSSGNATTNSNGVAAYTYTGTNTGNDTIQASASVDGVETTSNSFTATWLLPVQALTTTTATGEFFITDASCMFDVSPTATPVFSQTFPTINFNPPSGTIPGAPSSINVNSRPFTDVTTDINGNYTGSIVAEGNGYQAGVGPMFAFQAVFKGYVNVTSAGNVAFNFYDDDGFILGVGNGASRVSGASFNMPTTTPFAQLPVMGAYNGPTTDGPEGNQVVAYFPAAGSYPFELDYQECDGGQLVLTMTQGASSQTDIVPLATLTLSPNSVQPLPVGGQLQTPLTVVATDASANPVPNVNVALMVEGVNSQQLNQTTNSTGQATFNYTDSNPGTDTVQAVAFIGGMVTYSNTVSVPWTLAAGTETGSGSSGTLSVSIDAPNTLILPNSLQLGGTATDSNLPQGDTITTAWTQVSGPGNVSFANPQQVSTSASFSEAGSYVLQLGAQDVNASTSAQLTIVVNPEPGTDQGWIASPTYGATVSGIVPITVASGETLTGGVLTVYPASNPTAVTVLNSNTTGSGQIGTLDTTNLNNGTYWITLQATDSNGNTSYNLALVTVVGSYKPGRVTSTVTDLVVPAKGLAIQLQRTYDSLNAGSSSDFGFGWNLGTTVNLTVNPSGSVTFTLGGQRRTFDLTPQSAGFLPFYIPAFTPEPGMHGTLTQAGSGCADFFDYLVPDGSLWVCVGGGIWTPPGYLYTDPSGTAYTMTAGGQLQSIVDKNGNTLTVTPNGITSSTGLSVPFERDSKGRIIKITDPQGNEYLYGYLDADGNDDGNLQTVTYPNTPQSSTYAYDSNHLYLSGTDFLGNPLPSSTYYGPGDTDPNGNSLNGRLESVTDALSEKTSYAYDLTTNTTTITYPADAGGNVGTATMVYDSMGDILSSTDPLGHVTSNTYDTSQNLLTSTDPLYHTTCYTYDANGNRTSVSYPAQSSQSQAACSPIVSTTTYNQYSEPTQTTDELGNPRTFNYDVNFNPQSVTDRLGTLASFTFNGDGTMQSGAIGYDISSSPANASQFTYDADGNMICRVDGLGRATSYSYDSLGHKVTMTEPQQGVACLAPGTTNSATTTYKYDAFGNLTETDAPLGRTTSSQYDGNGNKQYDIDGNQHKTSYTYDMLNRLIRTDYPDSTYTHKTYDFRGNVVDEWDQAQNQTHHVYDLAGREVSVTRAYGTSNATTTSYTYYDDGRKNTETDALGHVTTYTYDVAGDLTAVSGVSGNFSYGYDNARNRVSMTDGDSNLTQYQYDARKRLTETDYPDGTKKTNIYDGAGNLVSVTDQNGNQVQYTYDAANQLQSVIQTNSPNAPNNVTSYGYDPLGNLIGLNDANSHLTESNFDLLSEQTSKTLPDGSLVEKRTYDLAGNLETLQHFNGKTTTYAYDNLNRLLSRTPDPSTGEPTVSFTYTATGKRQTMTDASGTTNYYYDSMDRLTQKATPEGTLNYTYDAAGHLASMTSSNTNGASASYNYDTLNRLSTVVDGRLTGNQTTTYGYDTASNVLTVAYPNGIQFGINYDQLNRLKQIATGQTGYLYTFDNDGNRKTVTELSNRAVNWTYDGINRLTNETISLDPNNKNGTVSYGLDPVGNRASDASSLSGVASGTFTFNADDELAGEGYDSNGNVTASGGNTFSYDTENHLVSMNAGAVTLVYDGDGNRAKKIVSGVTTQYLVDDLNPTGYPQVVDELTNGAVSRTYTYGLQRISQNQVISNTWTPSFYGYDGLGTVRQLTNSSGAITDTYDYDAFGNRINSTGSTPNNYLYRGEQFDSDLGLYYLRARYYNPTTGRFMSRDPENGNLVDPLSLHKYLYAEGEPVDGSDPSGRNTIAPPMPYPIPAPTEPEAPTQTRPVGAVDYALVVGLVSLGSVAGSQSVAEAVNCSLEKAATWLGGIGENIGRQMTFTQVGKCKEWVDSNRKKGDQIIIYNTVNPAPSCGEFGNMIFREPGGIPIGWTGMHQGILRGGTVYDDQNPNGIPEALWAGGAYSVPIDCSLGRTTIGSFGTAVSRGIGTITIESTD